MGVSMGDTPNLTTPRLPVACTVAEKVLTHGHKHTQQQDATRCRQNTTRNDTDEARLLTAPVLLCPHAMRTTNHEVAAVNMPFAP